jgi:SecD/SecF fusion protein
MNSADRRRLLLIVGVLVIFLLPLLINGPLSSDPAQRAIPLGLDLEGGVDVQISVDTDYQTRQLLDELKPSINPVLSRVLGDAGSHLRRTEDEEEPGLRLSLENPAEDANAVAQELGDFIAEDGRLASFDAEALATREGVVLTLNGDYLRRELERVIDRAARIVKERVDALGVAQSDVRRESGDRIRIQLPGQRDPDRVINNLVRPATLEFSLVYPDEQAMPMESVLAELINPDGTVRPGARIPEGYEVVRGMPDDDLRFRARQYLDDPDNPTVAWYLITEESVIRGEHLRSVSARPGGSYGTEMVVGFELNSTGTQRFRNATEANVGRRLAIVLEETVRSAPVINEAISYGRGQISGNFTFDEASDLENILKTGALPARLVAGETSVVGASLGEDSIRSGVRASLTGAALVLLFMALYYSMSGLIAIAALFINIFLVLGMLSLIRATLTLPGIAGIILTIGMAVDANVLIFERIREELRAGKSMRNAIGLGFNRAFSAIFDANVTTLITALVLLQFGFGPVRGFALTMTFGIFATLFTGLFVTQVFMGVVFNATQHMNLGRGKVIPHETKIDFMGKRHVAYIFSAVLILASLGDLVANRGPALGVDFSGGVQVEIAVDQVIGRGDVERALSSRSFSNPRVQTIQRANIIEETTEPEMTPEPGGAAETDEGTTHRALSNFLIRVGESEVVATDTESESSAEMQTVNLLVDDLQAEYPDAHIWVSQSRTVTAEAGALLRFMAILIAIVAAIFIFVYVAIRFDRLFGTAALVALFHDVFITLGVVTLLNVELSLDVVAALLTIMGYSLNDTIVVFDRMRENRHLMEGKAFGVITNLSINQVLSRTLITSSTTLLAVGMLLVFGGPGVHAFALTLCVGFLIGTYSSVFIAAPLVFTRVRRRERASAKS